MESDDLDTGTLALFVGFAAAGLVQDELAAAGFVELRFAHGYVFQHLIDERPTITELAAKLGVTQQAASKSVAELEDFGYVQRSPDPGDARVRRIELTPRGQEALARARQAREALEERIVTVYGRERLAECRSVLTGVLADLGGATAVQRREVRPPR